VRRALSRLTAVRRAHAAARNQIGQAAAEVDALVEDVEAALAGLTDAIAGDLPGDVT
jgi:hypothetical protein